ncbi:MAG: hypothetical protein OXF74_14610 [Rhodobacteraceae bacterium]|nr:hypothetical protein [Paracoccaceae bacterium]
MARSLDDWQRRIERHFRDLSDRRGASGLDVFAIEHGLENDDIAEISEGLRLHLQGGERLSPYWLLWVIYSTEHGYKYEGDEFWQSFEAQTPSWDGRHRGRLSQWFKKFHKIYNGVDPTGRWASHFSIISRPITHAILPKYLQFQFARELFHQRFSLSALTSLDPGNVGRRFASNAHHSSTRFQDFLQQEEIAGRIVLGLLGKWPEDGTEPIYPATMERIVGDLEATRNAGEWFREARRHVRDSFVGIASGLPGSVQSESNERDEPAPDVRPKVLLSRHGGGKWIVWAEVPSFKTVSCLSAEIRSIVRNTHCKLSGTDEVKPGGWLLYGNRRYVLKRWPDPAKPMILFERPEARLDNILQTSCRFRSGPFWLFRIGVDGIAREMAGGNLRPGGKYIVVSAEEQVDPGLGMQLLDVDCDGMWAYRLDAPDETTAEFAESLTRFSLRVVNTTRVWPAGLPKRGWDEEGLSEWLTTETPVIGMLHDYEVDRYLLNLNGEGEIRVEADSPKEPVFVRLPQLQVGKHVLTVEARRSAKLGAVISTPDAEGHLELRVRDPEPWAPGVASHSGLIGNLEPNNADLEMFWRNKVGLSVFGPEGRSVSARVRLRNRKGEEILSEAVGRHMELPLRPDVWKNRFTHFLNGDKKAWSYLEAASGELNISADELGALSFRFEHDVVPLRWILSRNQNDIVARLVDDTGREETELKLLFFDMRAPATWRTLSSDDVLGGWVVQSPGGLLWAIRDSFEDSVVVSCGHTGHGFEGLIVDSDFSRLRNEKVLKSSSLILYSKWHNARRYGSIIEIRWKEIEKQFLAILYENICGKKWAMAEKNFVLSSGNPQHLSKLQNSIEKKATGFGTALQQEYAQIAYGTTQDLQGYVDLAKRYHVCTDAGLAEFAFILATEAHRIPEQFGSDIDGFLNSIRENPSVLRGARFLHLAGMYTRKS